MANISLRISSLERDIISTFDWQRRLEHPDEVLTRVEKGVRSAGSAEEVRLFWATLICVRTNRLSTFVKDFFLPTLTNHALKVDNVVGRVFAILSTLYNFMASSLTLVSREIV